MIRYPLGDEYRLIYAWQQFRDAYRASRHEPETLTTLHGAEPLTVTVALEWAERLAREWLR